MWLLLQSSAADLESTTLRSAQRTTCCQSSVKSFSNDRFINTCSSLPGFSISDTTHASDVIIFGYFGHKFVRRPGNFLFYLLQLFLWGILASLHIRKKLNQYNTKTAEILQYANNAVRCVNFVNFCKWHDGLNSA